LQRAGYNVFIATDGTDGLRQAFVLQPDLILLDIMLPAMSGWTVCERLRQITDVPIIFITVLDQESHVVRGLGLGADDYVVKPYDNRELLARIEAVMRRHAVQDAPTPHVYVHDDLVIDFDRRVVNRGDSAIHLTPIEFRLLACLAENPGKSTTHSYLLRQVWGNEQKSRSSLKLYIWYLRRKLEQDPENPEIILTDRGVGYRLAESQ
jgi:two-component system KDP operon response regulator KdpE